MKAILQELNETIAARGALIVAPDGMLIASDVRIGEDVERLSAMGAGILAQVGGSLERAGLGTFAQVEVVTEEGKLVLVEAGPTYLLVLLGARLEIGPGSIEIRSAAKRIARATDFAAN